LKVDRLVPKPDCHTKFAPSHQVTVPCEPGCYALTTYGGDVLYVGLAATSIRSRIDAHLDNPEKRKGAASGAPFWVHYLQLPSPEVARVERGWMNQAILEDGELPPLNRVASPL
jgi:hypothetical protein